MAKYNHSNADDNYKKYLEEIKNRRASEGGDTTYLETGNNSVNGYNTTALQQGIDQGNTTAIQHAINLAKSAGKVSDGNYVLPTTRSGSTLSFNKKAADNTINARTKSMFTSTGKNRSTWNMGASPAMNLSNASEGTAKIASMLNRKPTEKQTNRKIAHTVIDDINDDVKAQIEDAINRNGGKTETFVTSDMANQIGGDTEASKSNIVEEILKKNGYSDDEAKYIGENWDTLNGIIETESYEKKRSKALDEQSDKAYELAKEYINANNGFNQKSDIEYQTGGVEEENKTENTMSILTKLMAETGLSLDDAYKYIQYVGEVEDESKTKAREEKIQSDINEHPVLGSVKWTAADILASPVSGLAAAGEALHRPADEEAPVNTNSIGYSLQNMGTATEEAVSDKINNPVGKFLYGTGVSIGKSTLGMALGGATAGYLGLSGTAAKTAAEAVTLPMFGGSAFASTLKEGQDKGLSDDNAVKYAVAAGAAEMILEKVGMDSVISTYNMAKAGKTGLKDVLVRLGLNASAEGSEEVFTDIANAISDDAINGAFSDMQTNIRNYVESGMSEADAKKAAYKDFRNQLIESFAGGALAGAVHGGIAQAHGSYNYKKMAETISTDERLSGVKENIIETARKAPEGTTARDIVDSKEASEITSDDLKQIIESEADLAGAEKPIEEYVTEKVKAAGFKGNEAKEITNTLIESASTASENVTEEQEAKLNETLNKSEAISDTYADLITGDHNKNARAVYEATEKVEAVKEENARNKELVKEYNTGKDNGIVKVSVLNASNDSSNPAYLVGMSENGKAEVYSETTGTRTVPLSSVEFNSTEDRIVWQTLSQTSKVENKNDATRIAKLYASTDVPASVYVDTALKVYDSGLSNIKLSSVKDSVDMSLIPETTVRQIYYLGQNERVATQHNNKISAAKRNDESNVKTSSLVASKVDPGEMALAKVLSKITGNDVRYVDMNKYGSNGYIDLNERTIVVALQNMGANSIEDTDTLRTLGHEALGEYIEHLNPEGKKLINEAVSDILVKAYGADTITKSVKARQKAYRDSVEAGKTMEEALSETVNDMIGDIMFTEEGIDKLVDYANNNLNVSEKKTFFETLLDLINKYLDLIKGFLNSKDKRDIVKKSDVEDLENARNLIMRELDKAVKNDMARSETKAETKSQDKNAKSETKEEKTDKLTSHQTYKKAFKEEGLALNNEISDNVAFSVGTEMSLPENDSKRAELLRHMTITPAQFDEAEYKKYANVEKLENSYKSEAEKIVKPIYKALGNTKVYKNYDIDLEFLYTTKGFLESLYNQQLREKEVGEKDFSSFAKLHTCLEDVIRTAKCIYESDEDRYAGTYRENPKFKTVYSLIGAFEDLDNIYPTRFIIKELASGNRLYVSVALNSIKKADVMALAPSEEGYRELDLLSKVNVARMIQLVNSKDGEFFKYVPDELLNVEQKESKAKAIVREQEKIEAIRKETEERKKKNIDNRVSHSAGDWDEILESVQQGPNENTNDDENINKTNSEALSIIEEGVESLKKVDIDVDEKMVHKIAKEILKDYSSKYNEAKLESNLRKLFAYIIDHDNVSYQDMMRVADELAKPILSETAVIDDSAKADRDRIVSYLKHHKIALDDAQKAEVAHTFGSYNAFRMRSGLMQTWSEKGTPLDNLWDELCDESNGYLNRGVSSNDQPITILETLEALRAKEHKLYEGKNMDDAAHDLSLDIFKRFFEGMSKTSINENKTIRAALTKTSLDLMKARKELDSIYAYKQKNEAGIAKSEAEETAKRQLKTLVSLVTGIDTDIQQMQREGATDVVYMLMEQKQRYEDRIKKLEKDNKNFKEVAVRQRNSKIKQIRRGQETDLKKRIEKNMNTLNAMLRDESEKKHVPVDMVKGVIDVCKIVTPKQTNSKVLEQKLLRLSQLYNSYQSDGTFMMANSGFSADNTSYIDYDRNLADKISRLTEIIGQRDYRVLEVNDLNEVYEITKAVITQIRNANKLMQNARLENAYEASTQAREEIEKSGGVSNAFEKTLDKYGNMHLNAYRFFRKISGYNDDGAIMSLYDELEKGQKQMLNIQRDIDDIFDDVLEGKENQKNVKKLTSYNAKDMVDIGLKDEQGKPVLVTRAMRLSLIMHNYNESNRRHFLGDGITIPDMKLAKAGKYEESYSEGKAKTYRLVDYNRYMEAVKSKDTATINSMEQQVTAKIKELENDLDDYEKRFLADAKKMFWEYTGKQINKVSVRLNGYAKAKVQNYFPIKVDPNFTARDYSGLIQDGTLEGMGMLKNRVMSKKAILLEDIVQVILRQTRNVSLYSGMAIPVRDMNMIMNMTLRDKNGRPRNLGETIGRVWGVNNTRYLKNLMQDVQGGRRDTGYSILDDIRGKFAGATLNLNLVVAMKQAASYPTAAAVVGYGPLAKAVKDMGKGFAKEKGLKELEERNALLWYRNKGNSTQELGDIKEKKGFEKELSKFKFLNWIQWMDSGTVRTLEYASKYYVDEQIKKNKPGYEKLKEGSYDYWTKVDEIFSKVVEETQPNYTTLQQADITRNPNKLTKQLFMFKTQPLQNFGIIYDAVGELRAKTKGIKKGQTTKEDLKNAKSKFAKAISSQLVAALVYSAMDVFAKALILNRWWKYKDDEEEEVQFEEMVKKVIFEGVPSTLVGGLIAGSEIYSFINSWVMDSNYYGVEVPSVETVNSFTESLLGLKEASDKYAESITEEDQEKYKTKIKDYAEDLATTMTTFFGVPLTNVRNMFDSIYRYANDISEGNALGTTTPDDGSIDSQMDRIVSAYLEGDTKRYKELREQKVEDTLETWKANDPETEKDEVDAEETVDNAILNKLKTYYFSGQVPESKIKAYLQQAKGYTEAKIEETIADWEFSESVKALTEAFESEVKAGHDLVDNTKITSAYDELKDEGYEEDALNNKLKNSLKDAYTSGRVTYDEAYEYLQEIGDDAESNDGVDEAYFTLEKWDYVDEGSYNRYQDMTDALEADDMNAFNDAKNTLLNHGIEEDTILSKVKTTVESLYSSGTITLDRAYSIMNSAGVDTEDITSKMKTMIKDGYTSNSLDYNSALNALQRYGQEDAGDAYYDLEEAKAKADGAESYSRYDALTDAISSGNGSSIVSEVNDLVNHGVEAKNVQSKITSTFKAQYLELLAQGKAANMQNALISAYMACGKTKDEAMKMISRWK